MEVGWYLRFKPDAALVFLVGHGSVDAALGALYTVSGWLADVTRYPDHAEIRFRRGTPDGDDARQQGPGAVGEPNDAGGGRHTGGHGKE
ncbi:hypothetical protein [Nitratidesulfovibrio liaohensis]|uniref:Uncharacterized protein n=1 Tax=Nitratidesulfovibrio liaohensis TaxID=2604158 RepID=A0ABY9R089_9BACT|nr:hypothetical protein [Nitratidesulfovibrio liaohensis]WMW65181.1 hypothetical protein KPS_003289 [Nitratidesulfovibrio liaohensis]